MALCLSVVCHKGMNAHISFWLLDITLFQYVSVCYKVTNAFMVGLAPIVFMVGLAPIDTKYYV